MLLFRSWYKNRCIYIIMLIYYMFVYLPRKSMHVNYLYYAHNISIILYTVVILIRILYL